MSLDDVASFNHKRESQHRVNAASRKSDRRPDNRWVGELHKCVLISLIYWAKVAIPVVLAVVCHG